MGRKVSEPNGIRVNVPENTTITQGEFYLLDGVLGMALQSVTTKAGETGSVILQAEPGEYETDQINADDAFGKDDKVYYDTVNKRFTTNPVGNRFCGVVTVAKDDNDVIWFVFVPSMAIASGIGRSNVTFFIPGNLAAANGKIAGFVFGVIGKVVKVMARVGTLPGATAAMSFDVKKGADSLFGAAKPSIASTDTADEFVVFTPDANPAVNVFAAADVLSIDIVAPGDTVAANAEIIVVFEQQVF
jgi:hypothetical protein